MSQPVKLYSFNWNQFHCFRLRQDEGYGLMTHRVAIEWCRDNVPGEWTEFDAINTYILIKEAQSAMLFKLSHPGYRLIKDPGGQ